MEQQNLSLKNIMEHFGERWAKAPDKRKVSNNRRHEVADGILAPFAVFFMQRVRF
jgi:hypothetical protein